MTARDITSLVIYATFLVAMWYAYDEYLHRSETKANDRMTAFEARLEGLYQERVSKVAKEN
jgi:hypothetical protein